MKRLFLIISILSVLCLISPQIFAHCGFCGKGKLAFAQEVSQTETIKGKVICLGCHLKKEKGAKAQCSLYGHINAIKTEDGKIWSILENDQSKELINNHDYAGKDVEIKGRKITEAQVIEVESFKILS